MPTNTKLTTVSCQQFRLPNPAQETTLVEITGLDGKVAKVITLGALLKAFNSLLNNWRVEVTTREKL